MSDILINGNVSSSHITGDITGANVSAILSYGMSQGYVDNADNLRLKEASLGTDFTWNNGLLDVSVTSGYSTSYIDGSLTAKANKTDVDSSLSLYVKKTGDVITGNLTVNASLNVGSYNTTNYNIRSGSFVVQPYALNNCFFADNAYWNGSSWIRINPGYASAFQLFNGTLAVTNVNTGTGTFTQNSTLKSDYTGAFAVGLALSSVVENFTGAKFLCTSTGRVGIGTINPTHTLDVSGPLHLTGSITTDSSFCVYNNIYTSSSDLILNNTNDSFGIVKFHLQNRFGSGGALFENLSLDLVDFGFKPNTGPQANMRFEHRSSYLLSDNSTYGEFQYIMNSTHQTAYTVAMEMGNKSVAFPGGKMGIGYNAYQKPNYTLDVSGAINAKDNFYADGSAGYTGTVVCGSTFIIKKGLIVQVY